MSRNKEVINKNPSSLYSIKLDFSHIKWCTNDHVHNHLKLKVVFPTCWSQKVSWRMEEDHSLILAQFMAVTGTEEIKAVGLLEVNLAGRKQPRGFNPWCWCDCLPSECLLCQCTFQATNWELQQAVELHFATAQTPVTTGDGSINGLSSTPPKWVSGFPCELRGMRVSTLLYSPGFGEVVVCLDTVLGQFWVPFIECIPEDSSMSIIQWSWGISVCTRSKWTYMYDSLKTSRACWRMAVVHFGGCAHILVFDKSCSAHICSCRASELASSLCNKTHTCSVFISSLKSVDGEDEVRAPIPAKVERLVDANSPSLLPYMHSRGRVWVIPNLSICSTDISHLDSFTWVSNAK